MAKVAVILSGCGFLDGSEIHESVLCLLALSQKGHQATCFAPDAKHSKVVNHLTNEEEHEQRSVLKESARIARGNIKPLNQLNPGDFDALLIPGGFGVASNLSNFSEKQTDCNVNPDLERALLEAHSAKIPIGATCITPAILAKVFEGKKRLKLTLGTDQDYLKLLEKMGMLGKSAKSSDMIADEENKIFTTPCYMEPPDLAGMYEGIKKVVDKLG